MTVRTRTLENHRINLAVTATGDRFVYCAEIDCPCDPLTRITLAATTLGGLVDAVEEHRAEHHYGD